jgi:hypothetical protein
MIAPHTPAEFQPSRFGVADLTAEILELCLIGYVSVVEMDRRNPTTSMLREEMGKFRETLRFHAVKTRLGWHHSHPFSWRLTEMYHLNDLVLIDSLASKGAF